MQPDCLEPPPVFSIKIQSFIKNHRSCYYQVGRIVMVISSSSPPEQGQLLNVRQRQFIVSEVLQSTLSVSLLKSLPQQAQHLVTLSSVEDDALGKSCR